MTDTERAEFNTEFNWLDDADEVIVREQPAIAVYTNPAGDVVLRQRGEDDAWIWFAPDHARAVAVAILEAAAFDATVLTSTPEPTPKSKDPTAAGRQRRYRERKKKESTSELFHSDDRDVTERDTATDRDGGAA